MQAHTLIADGHAAVRDRFFPPGAVAVLEPAAPTGLMLVASSAHSAGCSAARLTMFGSVSTVAALRCTKAKQDLGVVWVRIN